MGRKLLLEKEKGKRGGTSGLAWISTGKIVLLQSSCCVFCAAVAPLPCGANGDSMCDE